MTIIKKTSTHGTTSLKGRSIKYLAIHYTAGVTSKQGSARNTASWFASAAAKGTADFIVDDVECVQYNPDPLNRYCWAVGDKKYTNHSGGSLYGTAKNSNTISIEICSTNKTGKVTIANDGNWYFTSAAVDRAVELAKYLMQQYGIPASRVVRHFDISGKWCPAIKGWNADTGDESQWKTFKSRISGGASASAPESSGKVESVLDVDGIIGKQTVSRWQQIMGTPEDGKLSGQLLSLKKYHLAFTSTAVEYGHGGSMLIKAVQKVVGTDDDGQLGPKTIKAIQSRLGVDTDGLFGTKTTKALQTRLNADKF